MRCLIKLGTPSLCSSDKLSQVPWATDEEVIEGEKIDDKKYEK